jgi:hypothetical protein
MTSQINPATIDGNYPIAGVPNNTQGMRDNFTAIKTNFQYAETEIDELQSKGVFKAALSGTTLDNNMANNLIYNARIQGFSGTLVQIANTTGAITVDCSAAHYQTISMGGNISISFTTATWPAAGSVGIVRLQITVDQAGRTLTLPANVSQGTTGIQGYSANVITFAAAGVYEFGFLTYDQGTIITLFDYNRPLSYYTNNVTIAASTASTSDITGALIVGGGVGVSGNIVSGQNFIGNGALLTGITATAGPVITNGTSNISVVANANVRINVAGTSNVAVFASTGEYVTGVVSATGNITGGNVNTVGVVSASGNVIGGNINTAGVVSASGNVIGGNINTAGVVSVTGNITGSYFIGNGSQLTGVTPATQIISGTTQLAVEVPSGNIQGSVGGTANIVVFSTLGANITGYVTTTGNITGSNIITAGQTTATGNITGGNILTVGLISAAGNLTSANINATGNVSLTGNVIAGNLTTGAQVVAVGNVTGGNIRTDGQVLALNATAIPAGGLAGKGYVFSTTANFGIFFGSGVPTLSAAKGSLYLRSDGTTTNDRMYVNTNGSTTWTAVITAA